MVGWGRDEESWSISYQIIHGDPSAPPQIWQELDRALKETYLHASGIELLIRATCIDWGHYTQAVYNFVRPLEGRRVVAIKGVGGEGKALVSRLSKNNIGKVKLFPVGVDTAKEQIYGRLRTVDPGPGYCHFPMERDEEYFRQLTGEKIVTKYSQGRAKRTWIKTRARNESLDVRVYALGRLRF